MSDWQASRWLAWDGRWHQGAPPPGWWQAVDGHWHPPPASTPAKAPTRSGGAYRDENYLDGGSPDRRRSDRPPSEEDDAWADTVAVPWHVPPVDATRPGGWGPLDAAADETRPVGWDPLDTADANAAEERAADVTGWRHWLAHYRSWPLTARIVLTAAAAFWLLVLIGLAVVEPEAEQTQTAGTVPTTTTTSTPTTATTPTTPATAAPSSTSAPPTTPATTPSTTTTATAPPPPPPTATTPPPPAPTAASDCHASYSGCVPAIGSDVDCAGGYGDGPEYVTGPLQVLGPDVYGLDHDHDGTACEI